MEGKDTKEAEKLAEEHWIWLESVLHKIFVDAFIHGYKHGFTDGDKHGKETKCQS